MHTCSVAQSCLFATPWSIAHQVPLSMEFSRQEYWSELLFPPPGDLRDPGIEPVSPTSPTLADGSLPLVPPGKPIMGFMCMHIYLYIAIKPLYKNITLGENEIIIINYYK